MTAALCSALAACSVAPPGTLVHDPYEARNRQVHAFNKSLDGMFFSEGTGDLSVPDEIRIPVQNFADNTALPGMVVNGLLQGNLVIAGTNTMRFLLNTTIGFGGFFDPAGAIGLETQETDFGATLAVWGVPEGAYLELPVLGPSTERDLAGKVVDYVLDPLREIGTPEQRLAGTAIRIAESAIDRVEYGNLIDEVLTDSADSYAQARLIYLQNRRFELGDDGGDPTSGFVDPFAELE